MNRNIVFDSGRAPGEHKDSVSQRDGFRQIMGDQDSGNTAGADDISNVGGNHQPCLVIQGAEWFIQKKKPWLHHHGSDQGGALLHTAGELSRFFVLKLVKPIVLKELFRKGFFFRG